ncbi:MAG: segregation/condensation protein A [Candidatus Aminicenantes bacterium]|nr:segregation/condensation protein A [Candidatus Aminicenantes bacterium]
MEPELYRIQTEFYEGPLDLLLHLIKKNKMNIMDVQISDITSEYLYHLKHSTGINPSREGDFLMTASTLIYIKSRSLLPRPEILEEESPEEKLRSTLIEYDKVQKLSRLLKDLEGNELLLWKREEIYEDFANTEFKLEEISSFQLAEIFLNIIKRREREEFLYIESKNYSVEQKMEELMGILAADGYINFNDYVEKLDSIEEFLVSFFTLLEMIKQRMVSAIQKSLFDTISVWKHDTETAVQ